MLELMLDSARDEFDEIPFEFPRLPLGGRASEPSPRPLWLTASEAELLVSLCFASPGDGGEPEAEFFAKLGRFVRSFSL